MKKFSSFIAKTVLLSFFLLTVAPAVVPALSGDAHASITAGPVGNTNDNALTNTLCNAMQLVTGNAGKAFAAFAIISLGIGFFTGKISWGLMIGVSLGIAAMFGAPTVVAALSGGNAIDCGDAGVVG
jgi:type IV secretory pathway VirB2 component (pilin)